ncbi:DUF2478 domain-containing protein [Rhodovulum strictum]|uniref:DUF2478 domain-containing protein n=1 Tax=Rhodovulum strictum TaxID=58314 RepID=A0A844BBY8_9RHOB|nr:DUF2478 domain-containing protein [Rhodovulum strictum]MRH21964.1 DUF2478 domain-containing protein [Rhodovulum strictum]
MLGYITTPGRGEGDLLLAELANRLRAAGVRLAGAVQVNVARPGAERCDMDLCVLGGDKVWRISQYRGPLATGCRLDAQGLERAVGEVAAALAAEVPPELLIVNKFGIQEIEGRGFRPVIAQALLADVPVLTAVNAKNLPGFLAFAEGLAEPLAPEPEALAQWCLARLAPRSAPRVTA